jgi:hypothetical protein
MNLHHLDMEMERFILGAAMLLTMLLAGLVIANSFDEKCEGGWRLLSIPCHDPIDDYPHAC